MPSFNEKIKAALSANQVKYPGFKLLPSDKKHRQALKNTNDFNS